MAMDAEGIADELDDSLSWIEGRIRILEDHLHLATERPELVASQNTSTMIGVDATSKSVRVTAAPKIRSPRRPVVDPDGSIGAVVRAPTVLVPWRREHGVNGRGSPQPDSTRRVIRRGRRRRLRVAS
jgi:hypothetical protein